MSTKQKRQRITQQQAQQIRNLLGSPEQTIESIARATGVGARTVTRMKKKFKDAPIHAVAHRTHEVASNSDIAWLRDEIRPLLETLLDRGLMTDLAYNETMMKIHLSMMKASTETAKQLNIKP